MSYDQVTQNSETQLLGRTHFPFIMQCHMSVTKLNFVAFSGILLSTTLIRSLNVNYYQKIRLLCVLL